MKFGCSQQGLSQLTQKPYGDTRGSLQEPKLSHSHAPQYLPRYLPCPDSFWNFSLGLARPELHSVFQFFILQGKNKSLPV